jgi:hypothetical protein
MNMRPKRIVYSYDGLTQIVMAIFFCAVSWLKPVSFGGTWTRLVISAFCVFIIFRWYGRMRSEFIVDDGEFFAISTDAGRARYSKRDVRCFRMDWRRGKLQVHLKSGKQEEHRVPVLLTKKAIYRAFPEFQ